MSLCARCVSAPGGVNAGSSEKGWENAQRLLQAASCRRHPPAGAEHPSGKVISGASGSLVDINADRIRLAVATGGHHASYLDCAGREHPITWPALAASLYKSFKWRAATVSESPVLDSQLRVLLLTAGSRGDVEPFVSLASALRQAGHAVRVCVPEEPDAEHGPDHVSLGVSFSALAVAVSGVGALRAYREHIAPAMSTILSRVVDEATAWQPDVIVSHPKLLTVPIVAEYLGIPYLTVELAPVLTATAEFPAAGVLGRSYGPALNRLSYRVPALGERMFAADIRAARQRLGFARSQRVSPSAGSLIAVSPSLLARPLDWPAKVHMTGDWPRQPRPGEVLDSEVSDFLSDPAPLAYAGFGSMGGGDPASRAEALIEGARAGGLRVLLATGWGGLEPPRRCVGRDLLIVSSVPHALVLPHASVAIHHGGAGTVHAAARAGTPSVLVPFLGDQPFWARTLHRSGLTGRPLHRDRLTPQNVRAAIADAVGRQSTTHDVAERMRVEDGLGAAVAEIVRVAAGGTRR